MKKSNIFLVLLIGISIVGCSTFKSTNDAKLKSIKGNRVLLVGLDPNKINYSKIQNLTAEKLSASLENDKQQLIADGYDAHWQFVDLGETAVATLINELSSNKYNVIMIGSGIRVLPENFQLFENLINVVHQYAPESKICFNTNMNDSELAVKRWLKIN